MDDLSFQESIFSVLLHLGFKFSSEPDMYCVLVSCLSDSTTEVPDLRSDMENEAAKDEVEVAEAGLGFTRVEKRLLRS